MLRSPLLNHAVPLKEPAGVANAINLIEGHHRFLLANTGDTRDAHHDFFVQNTQGVLANNRHFLGDTRMEYQPNGDATTEGQSLEIIGYCYAYLATGKSAYLEAAKFHWDAYVAYFYRGQPIPETPQRWICNWLVNGKEPVLANYPVNPEDPTCGGYKSVPLEFTNGRAQIPHGAPYWGEYLDVATFAHRGHMTWAAINASVRAIQEDLDGLIDWQAVYDNYRIADPDRPWDPLAWVDWPGYLGAPYTPVWGNGSPPPTYPVDWIQTWAGTRVDSDGDIIANGISAADIGVVQLQDTSVNGVYLFNYAARIPVADGGYEFARNEPWHNRPVHAPLLGGNNQMGNAADAEVWFVDACYLLWQITGDARYKRALDSVFFTAHEYTYIDSTDRFFRQSPTAGTPFTDGISYDYTYPSELAVSYGRDAEGYITASLPEAGDLYLEQQSVWFRIDADAVLRVTVGAEVADGSAMACRATLSINQQKEDTPAQESWFVDLPAASSPAPVVHDVPVSHLVREIDPDTGEAYLVAQAASVTDYGGCTWAEHLEENIIDGRPGKVVDARFPDSDAGFIIGFWGTSTGRAPVTQIVYRSDAEFDLRIEDDDLWRWYWILPDTGGAWQRATLDPADLVLSGYQPEHDGDPDPAAPVLSTVDQLTVLLEHGGDTDKTFGYYCVNALPERFGLNDGWTILFTLELSAAAPFTAVIGDCTMRDYRLDSLAYCPGTIPFSNAYVEGSSQFGSWRGLPYPGYQYPMIYTIHDDPQYDTWIDNQIEFLWDAQQWYATEMGVLGPVASAYIWNRWDATEYGPADTWTMYHWGDDHAWDGYQPRAMMAGARAWFELAHQGRPVPTRLRDYTDNWLRFLVDFTNDSGGQAPTYFPSAAPPDPSAEQEFVGHMSGLYLGACCFAAMAGSQVEGLPRLIETLFTQIQAHYTVTPTPGHPMNGSWTPWASPNDNEGMFYGFWAGELLRGLGLYVIYHRRRVGDDFYATENT